MKRASEVPPEVESSGLRPVTSSIALTARSVKAPGLVTNTLELEYSHTMRARMRLPQAFASRSSTSARSVSCVWLSLKRMLNFARACAGITLLAVLPTSTEVNSRFDAWNCALPWSSGSSAERHDQPRNIRHRIGRAMRIGDVALHAVDIERAGLRAAAADLDAVAEHFDIGRLAEHAMVEFLAALGAPTSAV